MRVEHLCNVTLSRYFASIQVEREIADPAYEGDVIGLDLGLIDFAVTSDGQHFPNPKANTFQIRPRRSPTQTLGDKIGLKWA